MTVYTILCAALAGLSTSIANADVLQLAWDNVLDATYPAHGRDVATDQAGNVYVTGDVGQTLSIDDWITIKYDADGNEQWVRYFDGPANKNDIASLIEVGADGNIYVGGISYSGGTFGQGPKFDIVIIKYTPDGDVAWQHTFNSSYNNDDSIEDMVVMPDGSVYVVGHSKTPVGQDPDADYVIYRLSPSGELMWSTFWDGPFNRVYWLMAHAEADASGVSIAAVTEKQVGPNDWDDVNVFSFVKFSPDGTQLAEGHWEPPYNEDLPDTNWLHDAVLDSNGNMIMVGRYDGPYSFDNGPESPARALILKFSANGEVMWQAENDTEMTDEFNRIVLDDQDNVFLSGTYNVQGEITWHADHVTAAYDADGNFMWEHRFGFDGFFDGEGYAAINDAGELLVATGYYEEAYNENIRFLRYDRMAGAVLESMTYDQGTALDRVLGLALDAAGNMVITGWTVDYLPGGGYEGENLLVAKVLASTSADNSSDLNSDGVVDGADLAMLLGAWGACSDCDNCDADLDENCAVDGADLAILLGNWG